MLRIAHIFPRRDFFTRRESLEGPVNEFLQKCEQCGWKVGRILYASSNNTGTFNSCLIEYEVSESEESEQNSQSTTEPRKTGVFSKKVLPHRNAAPDGPTTEGRK